jgi:hypothetical protein
MTVMPALSPRELLEGIRKDVLDARLNFELHQIYASPKSRQKYCSLIQVYDSFFLACERAHFVTMLIALGRVFDTDCRNISIDKLLKTAPEYENIQKKTLKSAQGRWDGNVKELRDQILAHRPATIKHKKAKVNMRASMKPERIDKLIEECEALVAEWTRHAGCYVETLADPAVPYKIDGLGPLWPNSKEDTLALLDTLLNTLT